jgi:hypothetical protein
LGRIANVRQGTGGGYNRGQRGGRLLVGSGSTVPDLQREARQIDVLVSLVVVQRAGLFGIQIPQLVGGILAEERLIGPEYFLVLL